jgi:hypothetical protein
MRFYDQILNNRDTLGQDLPVVDEAPLKSPSLKQISKKSTELVCWIKKMPMDFAIYVLALICILAIIAFAISITSYAKEASLQGQIVTLQNQVDVFSAEVGGAYYHIVWDAV